MEYRVMIEGLEPGLIMHNGTAGLDTRSPEKREIAEIAKTKASNRTQSEDDRIAELETQISIYWDEKTGLPTLPPGMVRSCIETAARKLKQGPQVREGLVVSKINQFVWDKKLGETREELGKNVQFSVPVVVQRNRILRTRARFSDWGLVFELDCDDELVDKQHLERWLDIAGRRIGMGDWRPEKSGEHGRFRTIEIIAI